MRKLFLAASVLRLPAAGSAAPIVRRNPARTQPPPNSRATIWPTRCAPPTMAPAAATSRTSPIRKSARSCRRR
jgi:hypothetical protein